MKNIVCLIALMLGLLLLHGCYYDNPPEPALVNIEGVSFSTHIIPIFNKACNNSGCHDGTVKPDLTAANAYTALIGGGYIETTFPKNSILYQEINQNGMPPGNPLPGLDKALILKWIEDGAIQN